MIIRYSKFQDHDYRFTFPRVADAGVYGAHLFEKTASRPKRKEALESVLHFLNHFLSWAEL